MNYQKWLMALIMLAAVAWFLLAGSAFAQETQVKVVTWEAAKNYTNGDPLPYGKVWTAVNQYENGCPPSGPVVNGEARIGLPGVVQQASFDVPIGTCGCFEAVTWVYGAPVEQYLSQTVETEGCAEAAVCH